MAKADIAAAALPAIRQPRNCFNCDQVFYRRSSGKSDTLKCCSRECGAAWQSFSRAARKRAIYVIRKARCQSCSKVFTQYGGAKFCSAECRVPKPRSAQCQRCGAAFIVPRHGHGNACDGCHPEFVKEKKKEYARTSGMKAAARKKRKLRLRGVRVEAVNPLTVLDRDKWTCQLCGIKTPKSLRGSYDDRAPEVDHIIPIAEGGDHSYRNTQCACRKCNIAKAGQSLGQLRLFG